MIKLSQTGLNQTYSNETEQLAAADTHIGAAELKRDTARLPHKSLTLITYLATGFHGK